MTRKRAFTMVEMMLVVALTAMIVGTVTAVYAYTIQRLGGGVADASTQREAQYGLDVISATIGKAQTCSLISVSGNPCLKCIMPATCSTNSDGILGTCTPFAINRRSQERWGNGYRIWFYQAGSSGSPSSSGSMLWMAQRSDDSTPTSANTVMAYTYFPGNSNVRMDLIQSLVAASATYSNEYSATISVGAYSGMGQQPAPSNASTSQSYQFSLSRTTYMRGWRF